MSNIAIVLSAGSGSRMNSEVKKQYMELCGKPVIAYSLQAMEKSDIITDVIMVSAPEDIKYCEEEIVRRYAFSKVRAVVPGGKERYHSVMAGIDAAAGMIIGQGKESVTSEMPANADKRDYIFIHDGARPFVTEQILTRLYDEVRRSEACVAAVKSKDTIKIGNSADYVVSTPNRELTWVIQTPQVFEFELVKEAYDKLREEECGLPCQGIVVTDDAMVVETWTDHRVKLTEGSYENIKVTTPEDMDIAEAIIKRGYEV